MTYAKFHNNAIVQSIYNGQYYQISFFENSIKMEMVRLMPVNKDGSPRFAPSDEYVRHRGEDVDFLRFA